MLMYLWFKKHYLLTFPAGDWAEIKEQVANQSVKNG